MPNSKPVYVTMPPKREGVERESTVVAEDKETCAKLAAERFDLPVSAADLSNWDYHRSELEAASHPNGRMWRFKHPRCEGKYYIEEVPVA